MGFYLNNFNLFYSYVIKFNDCDNVGCTIIFPSILSDIKNIINEYGGFS